MEQAIGIIVNTINDLSQQYAILKGWKNEYLGEVKREADNAVALATVSQAGPRTKGGIIIAH